MPTSLSRRPPERFLNLATGVFIAGSVALLGIAAVRHFRPHQPQLRAELPAAVGVKLTAIAQQEALSSAPDVSLLGHAHVLYFFRTTCPYCESQRQHVGRLLASLPKQDVLTLSEETRAVTQGYWQRVGVSLHDPLSVNASLVAAKLPGLSGIPALVFIDGSGIVRRAILGRVLDWTERDMSEALAALR